MSQKEQLLKELSQMAEMMRRSRPHALDGYKYQSEYETVVREGTVYSDKPLSGQERDELLPLINHLARHSRLRQKECFANAYTLAMLGHDFGVPISYAEGFAKNVIAVNHAWCVFRGRPIDVTWREGLNDNRKSVSAVMERIDWCIKNCAYAGFVVPLEYLNKMRLKYLQHISVLDDWQGHWPVMKSGLAALVS